MGRTNPTFRDVLRGLRRRWAPFRRGLRREEQPVFDDLMEKAGAHADAAGYANPVDPEPLVLLSILLEQQAEIDALETRVDALTERLETVENREAAGSGDPNDEAATADLDAETDARAAIDAFWR